MNDYFKKIFNKFDDTQRSAVTSSGDFVFVQGGAGTGKSSVLCCHAAYMLERNSIKYDEILIFGGLPHSEKDIERQLHSLTGLNYSESCAHSFVSFCDRMLKKYWYLIDGVKPYYNRLDDFKRNVILQKIIENNGKQFWRYRDASLEIGRFITLIKQNGINADDYNSVIDGERFGRHYEYIGTVYRRYSEILQKHGYLDFEDIVNFTIRLFEDKESGFVLKKWKKIFVGDFHNITPNCYKLLKTLTKDALFATGDESQQILFGFRGDTVSNSIDILLKDYPGTETIQLNRNYRSGVSIIDAADRVYQAGEGDSNILSGRGDFKGIITAAVEKSIVDEAFYIGKKIEYLVRHKVKEVPADSDGDNRYSYCDCAVLIRNLDEFGLFYKQALDCLKIPNHIDGTQIYYRELDYLLSYLRCLSDENDDRSFMNVLSHSFSGLSTDDILLLSETCNREKKAVYRVLRDGKLREDGNQEDTRERAGSFIKRFEEIREYNKKVIFPDFILRVVNSIFFGKPGENIYYPVLKRFIEAAEDYHEFCGVFNRQKDLNDFLHFFENNSKHFYNLMTPEEEDSVTITSIYKARNKEFPAVFIPLLTENNYPATFSEEQIYYEKDFAVFCKGCEKVMRRKFYRTDSGDFVRHMDKEKALLAAGMLRAGERLYLSYPNRIREAGDSVPSAFLKAVNGGEEITKENCEKNQIQFEENIYSDFIGSISNCKTESREIYKHIVSFEELEIALKNIYSHTGDDEKIKTVLKKYSISNPDEEYIFTNGIYDGEEPVPVQITPDFEFSTSMIGKYLECPKKFYYSKLVRLEDKENINLVIGSIEHEIMQGIYSGIQENIFNEAKVMEVIDTVWERYKDRFDNEVYEGIWRDYVIGRIKDYIESYGHIRGNQVITEEAFRFTLDNKYVFTGRIDRIDIRDDGDEIIDYKKSGRGKHQALINKFKKDDKDFQMPIYYYAVKESLGMNPTSFSYIIFDFNSKRICEKVQIPIKPGNEKINTKALNTEVLRETRDKLLRICDEMLDKRISFERGENAECRNRYGGYDCEFLPICNKSQ